MDISSASSEWSSGCDSGWTFYLNESVSQSPIQHPKTSRKSLHDHHHHHQTCTPNPYEEEDLSMVSDASSGPPQIRHEEQCKDNNRFGFSSKNKKKNKAKEHSFLDDTASSSALNYPVECLSKSNNQHAFGFSRGNGLTGNSAFGDHIGSGRQQEEAEASRSLARRRK